MEGEEVILRFLILYKLPHLSKLQTPPPPSYLHASRATYLHPPTHTHLTPRLSTRFPYLPIHLN